MSETPETDAVIKNVGDGPYIAYLVHFARKLERERDEARRDLAAANRGAERNAKINQSLCAKLEEAQRERDEAMQMIGEQLHQLANEWTEEFERLIVELNAAREEVSVLNAKLKEEAK